MTIDLFNFIIDELSALKTNNDDQKLSKNDKIKKDLLIKSLDSVEFLLNDINQYQENYEILTNKMNNNGSLTSPLNSILYSLQIELTEMDKLSNNNAYDVILKIRRRAISKALPPLKKLADHINKS